MIKTTRGKAVTLHISRMLLPINKPNKGETMGLAQCHQLQQLQVRPTNTGGTKWVFKSVPVSSCY